MKILDLGNLFWADIGQHKAMRETFSSLIKNTKEGFISREISGLDHIKDKSGNILVNSDLGEDAKVTNSLILNSKIVKGSIKNSIVIDSIYFNAELEDSFVLGDRVYSIKLNKNSGSVNSLYLDHLEIPEGYRHVTIPVDNTLHNYMVHEESDLRNDLLMSEPILNNKLSFRELYDLVSKIPRKDFEESKRKKELEILNKIYLEELNIYKKN